MKQTGRQSQGLVFVEASVLRLSYTRSIRRWTHTVRALDASPREQVALVAVLLVESSARPRWVRSLEWLAALPLRAGVLGPLGRRLAGTLTLGPWQMRGAEWNRAVAAQQALTYLRADGPAAHDLVRLAEHWNGPHANAADRPVRYADALLLAARSASRLVEANATQTLPC